jgi:hypothetical protein
MKLLRVISICALFIALGTGASAYAQQEQQGEKPGKGHEKGKPAQAQKQEGQKPAQAQKQEGQKPAPQPAPQAAPPAQAAPAAQQAQPEQRPPQRAERGRQVQEQRAQQAQAEQQQRATKQQERAPQQQQQEQQRVQRAQQVQVEQQQRAQQAQAAQAEQQRQRDLEQQRARQAQAVQPAPQRVQSVPQPAQSAQATPNRPPGWDKGKKVGWNGGSVPPGQQARLPQDRQRQLIDQQQQRITQYQQVLDQQQRLAQQQAEQLQQQKRTAQYQFQQQYLARLREQRVVLTRQYDYYNDPYFYTPPTYRYYRAGSYYNTNEYGARMLRQAINFGYEEGYRAGLADRSDRWRFGYQDSYAFQDANYGYTGFYVDQGDYNYYFREGFRRGYEDGFYGRYQYGRNVNGSYSILGGVLSQILRLTSLR